MRLRIHIDGRWSAREFALMLAELDALYADLLERRKRRLVSAAFVDVTRARLNPDHGLTEDYLSVVRIAYGSPGFSDFFGAAGLVSELRQFIQFLIDHFRTRDLRRLEAEQLEIDIAKAKLALLERIAAVAKEQEMRAAVQEQRANLVAAEAKVPDAIADAFRQGNLGVMDYYNLRNIEADTKMRRQIGGEEEGSSSNE